MQAANPVELGIDPERLETLARAVEDDVAADLFRWAAALRRGGEVDGVRPLSPALARLATRNHTGGRPNSLWSLGAGSAMLWVDPERDLAFVCLTAGLVEETRSVARFPRLSDLVLGSVVD